MPRTKRNTPKPAADTTEQPEPAKLRTLDELGAAEADAKRRKRDSLGKLARNDKHPSAVQELYAANADLQQIATERATVHEIERVRREHGMTASQREESAALEAKVRSFPARILEQGVMFEELVVALNRVTEMVTRIENSQREIAADILQLPGDARKREMLVRAARTAPTAQVLRPALRSLASTKLLDLWLPEVRVPAEPDRTPSIGESHAAARARAEAAAAMTAEAAFAQTAANVERLLAGLLEEPAAPESSEPVTPWHGSTKPNGGGLSSAEVLAFDDRPMKAARRRERVANSSRPITRDSDGRIVAVNADEEAAQ